jgi:serine/threonine protein kinase/tetratricopeptide (TPR) repeat protein
LGGCGADLARFCAPNRRRATAIATADEPAIFNAARQITAAADRRAYLEEACGDDAALRARIEALLRVHDEDRTFLAQPAVAPGGATDAVIGPYRLVELIGEGGMGTVYRAEQTGPVRRQVALKIIRPGMDSRQVLARFEAERQALALMDHPNIARVFDAGQSPPLVTGGPARPYFVMELVSGVPITRYCDERRLTPRQRLELFVPVCRAVQHAHQKGVIHRDIKPSNVLVAEADGRPVPKVIDFGVAKATGDRLTNQTLETSLGAIIGTLEYMSPEQAEPGQPDIDTRSDVYSLGVLLYELLTGTTPFDRKRLKQAAWMESLRVIREEDPPKPSTRLSTIEELPSIAAKRGIEPGRLSGLVRGELDWIVMKSLEKDRGRRYATANGLAQDIENYLADAPVAACPPSVGYRLSKFARRHKVALAAAAACVAVLLAATVVSAWQAVRATAAERHARDSEATALAARARADAEAANARAVSDFLQNDLLGQADAANQPSGARNPNITVREVLDRAGREVERKFAGRPQIEAATRLTLGRTYTNIGEYAAGRAHLERSLALRRSLHGDRHPDALDAMSALGHVLAMQGHHDEAESLFKHVLEVREKDLGPDDPQTLRSKMHVAQLYALAKRYDWGESKVREVLDRRLATLGPDHSDTHESQQKLGMLYQLRGLPDEAEPYLRQALAGYRARLGPDHPATLICQHSLANNFRAQKRYAEAEPLIREVIEVRKARLAPNHPATLLSMFERALLIWQMGRLDEAAGLFEQVLQGRRARLGPDHNETLAVMNNLAIINLARGRAADAEPLFREVVRLRRARFGVEDADTIIGIVNLGRYYYDAGRLADADPFLAEGADLALKHLTIGHSYAHTAVGNLALLRIDQGRLAEAERLLRRLLDFQHLYLGPHSDLCASARSAMALCLNRQGKFTEAEAEARTALAARVALHPDSWQTSETRSILGEALAGQKRFAEAEPLLQEGFDGLRRRRDVQDVMPPGRYAAARDRLVRLYEAWGKPAEAERVRHESVVPSKN